MKGNVRTAGGDIDIIAGQNASGYIGGYGVIDAGTGNVSITNADGFIYLASTTEQVRGNGLTVTSSSYVDLDTDVDEVTGTVSGASQRFAIADRDGLTIGAAGITTNNGPISVTAGQAAAGDLTGTGQLNAGTGSVVLTNTNGGITLNSSTGQILGNSLSLTAKNTVAVNTNITFLTADVTDSSGTLTVREVDTLAMKGNVRTAGGDIDIIAGQNASGYIGGYGVIDAAEGNIAVTNQRGIVYLASTAEQVTGNAMTVVANGQIALNSNLATLSATANAAGAITVNEADDLNITSATTTTGAITIKTAGSDNVAIHSMHARSGSAGDITLITGNIDVYPVGISATGTLDMTGVTGFITVQPGGAITSAETLLSPNGTANTVYWIVDNGNGSGNGSLPDVLEKIDQFNANSTIKIDSGASLVVNLTSPLAPITTPLTIDGSNNLTIDGSNITGPASGLVFATDNITISSLTLQNFNGPGIDLPGSKNSSVLDVTVLNSSIGIRASGDLSGTVISGSTFQYNGQGGVLSAASNLQLGLSTASPNRFLNSTTYGLSIAGRNGGTTIYGNEFENNPTAISLASAEGVSGSHLLIGPNPDDPLLRNTISYATVGVFATGFCTYTEVNYINWGPGVIDQYDVATSRNLIVRP